MSQKRDYSEDDRHMVKGKAGVTGSKAELKVLARYYLIHERCDHAPGSQHQVIPRPELLLAGHFGILNVQRGERAMGEKICPSPTISGRLM